MLVLDEDGTAVETESFFRTLEEGTALMALSEGQAWTAPKVRAALRGAGGWFVPCVPRWRWHWEGGVRWVMQSRSPLDPRLPGEPVPQAPAQN